MTDPGKILEFPNREVLHEQAAGWIARLDDGGLGEEEIEQLKLWANQSEQHKRILLQTAGVWDRMDMLAGLSGLLGLDDLPSRRKRFSVPALSAIAASLVCLGILVYHYTGNLRVDVEPARVAGSDLHDPPPLFYETAVGAIDVISLEDGSVVKLNTATRIEVDILETRRNITLLQGEAYFDVVRYDTAPFVVSAGTTVIRALGTAFSVHKQTDRVEVTVTEGLVRVKRSEEPGETNAEQLPEPVLLRAGQVLQVGRTDRQEIREIETAEIARRLLWQQKMLAFNGNTLRQVIDEFSRYTNLSLVIADAETASIRVGGYFRSDDVAGLLTSLEENFAISVSQVAENTFELRKSRH